MGYTTTIRSKRQRVVAALDIGTSKICLIAKTFAPAPNSSEGKGKTLQFEVLGFDHTRAEGLKAGMITHLDSAEAVRLAVDPARAHGRRHRRGRACDRHRRPPEERELLGERRAALRRGARGRRPAVRRGRQYAGRDKHTVLHALPMSYRIDENGHSQQPPSSCAASQLPSISTPSPPTTWRCATSCSASSAVISASPA